MTALEYHPEASDEVSQAFDWYRDLDPAVARKFKIELDRAESLVMRSPEAWSKYLHGTRGFRFRRFPFVMAFMVREKRIVVIAVAHIRRKPGYWRARITGSR